MQLQNYVASLDRGGVSKLAVQLGVTVSFLSQMSSGYTRIPPSRALAIEVATKGLVTRRSYFLMTGNVIGLKRSLILPPK